MVTRTNSQISPQQATLVERLVGLLPLPYLAGSLIVAALLSPPGFVLFQYLDTGDLNESVLRFFGGLAPDTAWQRAAALALWFTQTFYLLWLARYMRLRILEAEKHVLPLLPDGKSTYDRAFGHISLSWPPLLLALLLLSLFSGFIAAGFRDTTGGFGLAYNLIRTPLVYLVNAAALWVYASGLWGLHQLGRQRLHLRPVEQDSRMGLRPMGSLSLSLNAGYFGLLILLMIIARVSPVVDAFTIVLVGGAILGVVLFFLPLNSVHRQMVEAKEARQAAINRDLTEVLRRSGQRPAPAAGADPLPATLAELTDAIYDLKDLFVLEAAVRKAGGIATWPVDTATLRWLVALISPIALALVIRALENLLGL